MRLREVKNKINLTQNIFGVTQALELISAVKMKRAVKSALASRPFARKVVEILIRLGEYQKFFETKSLYFQTKKVNPLYSSPSREPRLSNGVKKILAIVLASDRGFCGLYNKNILKFAEEEIEELKKEGEVEIITLGKKAINFFKKKNEKIKAEILGVEKYEKFEAVKLLVEPLFRYFQQDEYQKICFFGTHYFSPFFQLPRKIQILPLDVKKLEEMLKKLTGQSLAKNQYNYIFEPSYKEIVSQLILQLIETEIYHAILEAQASEHASRMMAMKRAMDNAKEIIKDLTLEYNKARQAQITAEVSEITSAKEATV